MNATRYLLSGDYHVIKRLSVLYPPKGRKIIFLEHASIASTTLHPVPSIIHLRRDKNVRYNYIYRSIDCNY
jgi:hypothetical protein